MSASLLIPTPHMIQLPKLTCQERYDIYCKEVKIAECRPAQVCHSALILASLKIGMY